MLNMIIDYIKKKLIKTQESELYIHIGPGKTGTSVIQNWCLNNQKYLKSEGVYYPKHTLDINGVSGGHQFLLFNKVEGKWQLDKTKLKKFEHKHKASKLPITLISSELFWLHIDELAELFPQAKFIFYIRSSLEFFESSYNQTVKRHNATKPISERLKTFTPIPYGIRALLSAIDKFGRHKFIIKLYDRQNFIDGNILFDFFDVFGLHELPNVIKKDINPSYSFEALEFKRWINTYKINKKSDNQLDKLLQRYPAGNSNFSLLSAIKFERFQKRVIEYLTGLLCKLDLPEKDVVTYLSNVKSLKQKPFIEQNFSDQEKEKVLLFIKYNDNELYKNLLHITRFHLDNK